MTAVANPPSFRPAWGSSADGNGPVNSDEVRGMFAPRKTLSRSSSASSMSSAGSDGSNTTVASIDDAQSSGTSMSATSDATQWSSNPPASKRAARKAETHADYARLTSQRAPGNMMNPAMLQSGPSQQPQMMPQQQAMRPSVPEQPPPGQPVLFLLSLNGTFERKTIAVPFAPDSVRIGRQTNQKTLPTPANGFFDSKVLSRQHAEIYAERNGKIFIRDVKSSNGTFVNGTRLSPENRDSEPHELQTADHLELGIDIVSEDQKTVVHHKVAAKVEHSGFISALNNVMDMNFGDLDPANGNLMANAALPFRGRQGSNASINGNGRLPHNAIGVHGQGQANMMPQQRPFFLTPVATDQILKRLTNEMRSARLQSQDLHRTQQFITTLLSKDDVKDSERPDLPEIPKAQPMVNGNNVSFRADGKIARFSDPPAPPPQAPLPEKPDVPSLKRGPTERPKLGPNSTSPAKQDNTGQILQLTKALDNAKRDMDAQSARMRELEIMLERERTAREFAEDLAKRLEENTRSFAPDSSKGEIEGTDREIPKNTMATLEDDKTLSNVPTHHDSGAAAGSLQSRIDTMDGQMQELKQQLEQWKQRCEVAESERDADRKTLAEMVVQLRADEARRLAQEKGRSRSQKRRTASQTRVSDEPDFAANEAGESQKQHGESQVDGTNAARELEDNPTLSRANTITPHNSHIGGAYTDQRQLQAGMPYASMVGVVLIGMGLMAYLNGWQTSPPRIDH